MKNFFTSLLSLLLVAAILSSCAFLSLAGSAQPDTLEPGVGEYYSETKGVIVTRPYYIPSKRDVIEAFSASFKNFFTGKLDDSQNELFKQFMYIVLLRMCDSPEYNLNFDYDAYNHLIYDDDSNGLAKIGFDYDANQGIFYSAQNPWERNFGYCLLYDMVAPAVGTLLYTERYKFDYNGYEWMLQVWKGKYGWISLGAEIGLYYREPGSTLFNSYYNSVPDELMIDMQMEFYHNGEKLFIRPMQRTWWQTGFVVNREGLPSQTAVTGKIRFPDSGMRDALLASFEANGRTAGNGYVLGADDIITFSY